MPRTAPAELPGTPVPWTAWSALAVLALVGFCFGVWAGTQKPERVTGAQATPPRDDPAPSKTEPTKADAPADPKPTPTVKEPDRPAPKKEAAGLAGAKPAADPKPPEPKKTEPKKPEEKKPEPKKPEPKKVEPKKPDPKPSAPAPTFARDVVPVFRVHCLNCHGGVGVPKGGLDLRTLAATLKGGDGGPGVKANDPDGSPVWQQIEGGMMPPDGKPRLTEKEKKVVRDWIAGGAK